MWVDAGRGARRARRGAARAAGRLRERAADDRGHVEDQRDAIAEQRRAGDARHVGEQRAERLDHDLALADQVIADERVGLAAAAR